jgi:hypothetical protein
MTASLGSHRHVQVPGGSLQLAKIVDLRTLGPSQSYMLVRWIDIRRDAEWVPESTVPPIEGGTSLATMIKSVGGAAA